MKVNVEEIIVKVKLTEGKLKAIVALDFGDFVLRGFRIQDSDYENERGERLWLTPPVYRGGVKYHPIVFFTDKDLWGRIQKKIWDSYDEALKTRYTKAYDLSEQEAAEYFKS